MTIENVTPHGEITYNTETGLYTVWDEAYCNKVCVTPDEEVAREALRGYGETLE